MIGGFQLDAYHLNMIRPFAEMQMLLFLVTLAKIPGYMCQQVYKWQNANLYLIIWRQAKKLIICCVAAITKAQCLWKRTVLLPPAGGPMAGNASPVMPRSSSIITMPPPDGCSAGRGCADSRPLPPERAAPPEEPRPPLRGRWFRLTDCSWTLRRD